MADNSKKLSELPSAPNVAVTDKVLILYQAATGAPSTRTANLSTLFTKGTKFVYGADYTAQANDEIIIINNNGTDRRVLLPNSNIVEGKTYTIKKATNATTNTVVSANGLLIDGSTNININSGYGYLTVSYSNTSGAPTWWITSNKL
jgi:hypothetical protein